PILDRGRWHYYYPGFESPDTPDKLVLFPSDETEISRDRNWVPIIKLHGSANWFAYRRGLRESESNPWVAFTAAGEKAVGEIVHETIRLILDNEITKRGGEYATKVEGKTPSPAIIPPMLGKASIMPVIASQWRAAINLLKGARELWIVGYSFPSTDTF